ncbi:MAG: hypothetical protein HYS52_00590 [Candidatus Wildermuthbacteria bacterium]|nr:hypothetical protein [Candidatus Wildermuthbacteria bacterium]
MALIEYARWHFFAMPLEILKGWRNFLWFGLNYFSLPLLLQTYFSPWRRLQWSAGRGFNLGKMFEALVSNLISRIIGASIRTSVLLVGILVEIFLVAAGALVFVGWFALPVSIAFSFYYGFKLL